MKKIPRLILKQFQFILDDPLNHIVEIMVRDGKVEL